MKYNLIIIKSLLFVFLAFNIACKADMDAEPSTENDKAKSSMIIELTDAQLKNAAIGLTKLEEKQLPTELTLNGKVFTPASKKNSVHSPIGAYIKTLPWIQGMSVRKGQLLAVVEDLAILQLQQDYLQANNHLELADLEWKRQQSLLGSKSTSDKSWQEAKHAYEQRKIEVMGLKQKLRMIHLDPEQVNAEKMSAYLNLYAPENGFIQAVHSNVGDYINPQDEILTLLVMGETLVSLNAFEKDIPDLTIGTTVQINAMGNENRPYNARVSQIGKVVGTHGVVEVICNLNKAAELIEGQFVTGRITLASKKALCVPEKSLVRYEGKEYLFIKKSDKQFLMSEVLTGVRNDGWVEVKNIEDRKGLQIVTEGSYTLLMKLKNVAE